MKIKICGISDKDIAIQTVAAGADYIGLNFVPSSRRYIEPAAAKEIVDAVKKHVAIVGVFQNENHQTVNEIADYVGLDFVQLHGEEDAKYLEKIAQPVIKRIKNYESGIKENSAYLLVDRITQGAGDMVDIDFARTIAEQYLLFFSGGLTSENVADVVKKVKPYAVDVSGGVETEGKKDIEKIKQFINIVESS